MKILFTGGHFTPALAVIQEFIKFSSKSEIVFVGRKYAIEGSHHQTVEQTEIEKLGLKFIPITTGRLSRVLTLSTFVSIAKIPAGFWQAYQILKTEKPQLIITFGGYIGLPISLVANLLHIPVYLHEQTITPGLTSQIVANIAKRVFTQFPNVSQDKKWMFAGLPFRSELFRPAQITKYFPEIDHKLPVIYISGGSTGSVSVNEIFYPAISTLCQNYQIIHQTGAISIAKAQQVKDKLPKLIAGNYHPIASISVDALSAVYQKTDLFVGRSGANTIGELSAIGKVAIFIPLPWAARNEQFDNAKYLLDHGAGVLIAQQKDLSPEKIIALIDLAMNQIDKLKKQSQQFMKKVPRDAAHRIYEVFTEDFP